MKPLAGDATIRSSAIITGRHTESQAIVWSILLPILDRTRQPVDRAAARLGGLPIAVLSNWEQRYGCHHHLYQGLSPRRAP